MNVLLVDDETNVQKIVGSFLERYASERSLPVSIKALCDPVQGLFEATANGGNYDMIMLDVRLPKLTGDEIYNSLRHVSPDLLDRVLFVTGYPEDLAERFGTPLYVVDEQDARDRAAELKAAFDAASDAANLKPFALDTFRGYNYSKGKWLTLTLYGAKPH